MSDKPERQTGAAPEELRNLIDRDPSEEIIHQFFKDTIFRIGHGNPRFSERFIDGTVSKFPITPDRIPDFTSVFLNVARSQRSSRVSFVELKKPSSPLFTGRGAMSKDLNDAWMECVESSRLMADNFRDCLRRLVKSLDAKRLQEFDAAYAMLAKAGQGDDQEHRHDMYDMWMPWCNSVIVIGRRSSLDSEGLLRTRELSASTGRTIQVVTYDTVLDWVSEADKGENRDYRNVFLRGWYWY